MDIIEKILSLQEKIKIKIEHSLKNGNTEAIVAAAKELELMDRLENQYREIEKTVFFLEQKGNMDMVNYKNFGSFSKKQIGEEERKIFVQEARNKNKILAYKRGPLYEGKLGRVIGIPYASECKPGRWWLGLPKIRYNNIVLICKNEFSERTYFIFSYSFCEKYQDKLSTDKKEKQIKFNVLLKGGIYRLLVPDSDPVTINEYINQYDNIDS